MNDIPFEIAIPNGNPSGPLCFKDLHYTRFGRLMADYLGMRSSLIFGKIKYVKDEIVTSTGFTNATPQRKVNLGYVD